MVCGNMRHSIGACDGFTLYSGRRDGTVMMRHGCKAEGQAVKGGMLCMRHAFDDH